MFRQLSSETGDVLEIPMKGKFMPQIDLSIGNLQRTGTHISEFATLDRYVRSRLEATGSPVVWGGYLEHRLIYNSSPLFHQGRNPRSIHLGLDFWTQAGTAVFAPLAGVVHSFQDNATFRDYGPTIVLRHSMDGKQFHSLYGHLSPTSLLQLEVGMEVQKGQCIGWLGYPEENGQWPPHLHFQIILDMQGHAGDYPGVCAVEEVEFYSRNCPHPRFLLGI